MERKRKLPARAAARSDLASKKRTVTPPEKEASATPAPEPTPAEEPPQLPKSIQPGKPLPTVEAAQPQNLSSKEFQSIQERLVVDCLYIFATSAIRLPRLVLVLLTLTLVV